MRGEPMWQRGALYIFFLFLPCFHVGGAGILFLGWITFSLRMPASGVPNYLTAHHHYKTAHRRRLLARWALDRNQGAPHGEERKKQQICKGSHQIVQLLVLFFDFAENRAPFALCSFCAPPLAKRTEDSKKLRTATSKRDSELALCFKRASTQEIIQHKLFEKKAVCKLKRDIRQPRPGYVTWMKAAERTFYNTRSPRHANAATAELYLRITIVRKDSGGCCCRFTHTSLFGTSPWRTLCRPVSASRPSLNPI